MSTRDLVTEMIDDLRRKVEAGNPKFKDKTVNVYSQDEVLLAPGVIGCPAIAITYLGWTSTSPSGQTCSAKDLTGNAQYGLWVLTDQRKDDSSTLTGATESDFKNETLKVLKSCRDSIKLTQSPAGGKWALVREAPAPLDDVHLAYLQIWRAIVHFQLER